jgi:hypothetical protein
MFLCLLNPDQTAAVCIAKSLFQGMDTNALYSIPADILRDMYRQLRYVEDVDGDELVRYHAKIALTELDRIMRAELFKSM